MAAIKQEASRVNKLREQTVKKTKQLEEQRGDVEKERDTLRAELASLERDLESRQKEVDAEKKKLEELMRERDVLNKLRSQVGGWGVTVASGERGGWGEEGKREGKAVVVG